MADFCNACARTLGLPEADFAGEAEPAVDRSDERLRDQDVELIRTALGSSKQGGGLGFSGQILEHRRRALVGDPVMESYLDLGGLYKVPVVQMFPHPVQPPANLPPMAHFAGVVDGEVGMQLFLPTAVVGFLKDLVLARLQSGDEPRELVQ